MVYFLFIVVACRVANKPIKVIARIECLPKSCLCTGDVCVRCISYFYGAHILNKSLRISLRSHWSVCFITIMASREIGVTVRYVWQAETFLWTDWPAFHRQRKIQWSNPIEQKRLSRAKKLLDVQSFGNLKAQNPLKTGQLPCYKSGHAYTPCFLTWHWMTLSRNSMSTDDCAWISVTEYIH